MGLLETYLDFVKPYKGSTRFHTWCAISAASATVEKRVWYPKGPEARLNLNQYIWLVGGPGTGKTFSADLATEQIRKYNKSLGEGQRGICFGPNKATPAALLLHMSRLYKTIRRPFESDYIGQSALYLYSRELSSIIKDIGGGSFSDDLLDLYDMGTDDYVKELAGNGILKIKAPCLNILACTTPSFLSSFMPRENSGTGLTARVMFICETRVSQKSYGYITTDKSLELKVQSHLRRLHKTTGPIQPTKDALNFIIETDQACMRKIDSGLLSTFMTHFYARKTEHLIKVGSILSLMESSRLQLTQQHLEKALDLIESEEPYMGKSFGVQDFKRTPDASKLILEAIPFHTDISRVALQTKLYSDGVAGSQFDFENLLNYLIEGKMVQRKVKDNQLYYRRLL